MKRKNLLSKAEMKAVSGGNAGYDCQDWRKQEHMICFTCCITVYSVDECMEDRNCGVKVVVFPPNN